MPRWLIVVMVVLVSLPAGAEIYRWVDADGKVHFGDRPPRDAGDLENLDLGPINSVPAVESAGEGDTASSPAARAKRVVMYSTSWCGYCAKARKYFRSKGVRFVEHDVEKSARGKREYDALGGKGYPLILVGDARMNGFNESGFERLYRQ